MLRGKTRSVIFCLRALLLEALRASERGRSLLTQAETENATQ